MYSPIIASKYAQAVQADIERDIKKYQLINAAAEKKGKTRMGVARLYRMIVEKASWLSNTQRDQIQVTGCT